MPAEIHPRLESDLRKLQRELREDGTIRSREQLQRYYDTFRRAFGPERLRSLHGEDLLVHMHDHGNRQSLVYWLEYKDDEEFPAVFGKIGGGSALKFGFYRRSETRAWAKAVAGTPTDISLNEAIELAVRNRDQLVRGADVLSKANASLDAAGFASLQAELEQAAPDVADTSWGHKYFAILFPELLDDFHSAEYQRYELVRMLHSPPRRGDEWLRGRYVCAAEFRQLAAAFGSSMYELTTLLNRRNGRPLSYWRIGTTDDERERGKFWPMMRDEGLVAVGWPKIGDLAGLDHSRESRKTIEKKLAEHYPAAAPQLRGRQVSQIAQFVGKIAENDRVVASAGQTVLGVGQVTGGYLYNGAVQFPHQRPVLWLSRREWKLPEPEGLRTTVAELRDYRNLVEVERAILDDVGNIHTPVLYPPEPRMPSGKLGERLPRLESTAGHIQSVLERKGQVVLYGPPGTGKTYWALRTARDLASLRTYGITFDALEESKRRRIVEGSNETPPVVRVTSFHPEYGYEDFIGGFRPALSSSGQLVFNYVPGVFRQLCKNAATSPDIDFFLIIDELNRGDVPRIFGELLTVLERDKRGEPVALPITGETLTVPPNVYVIGTMNTADRSIALLDVALRRRFGFVELMPDYGALGATVIEGLPLASWLEDLNKGIRSLGGGDSRNRQIGHAFLLAGSRPITTAEQLVAVLRDEIVPLLEEYCYDDFKQLSKLLGAALLDIPGQRVKRELLVPSRVNDVVSALLKPEISTAAAAISAIRAAEVSPAGGEPGVDEEPNIEFPEVGA